MAPPAKDIGYALMYHQRRWKVIRREEGVGWVEWASIPSTTTLSLDTPPTATDVLAALEQAESERADHYELVITAQDGARLVDAE